MCGFFCYLYLENQLHKNQAPIKMTHALASRRPDNWGYWHDVSSGFYLGHRRLAVVDLSPFGHQLMPSACGRYMIKFNGEIYNHLSLSSALEAPAWRGHSNTETLLACFSAWGIEMTLQATAGMLAIALLGKQERILTPGKQNHSNRLWCVLMLQAWLETKT